MSQLMGGVESYGKMQLYMGIVISGILTVIAFAGSVHFFRKPPRTPSPVCPEGKFPFTKTKPDGSVVEGCKKQPSHKMIGVIMAVSGIFLLLSFLWAIKIRNNPYAAKRSALRSLFT